MSIDDFAGNVREKYHGLEEVGYNISSSYHTMKRNARRVGLALVFSLASMFMLPGCGDMEHNAQCEDGIDNNSNGYTDWPDDSGCDSPLDDFE